MSTLWIAVQLALVIAAVLAAAQSFSRRVFAGACLLGAATVPWFAPPVPMLRLALTALALIAFLRVVDIACRDEPRSTKRRLQLLFAWYNPSDPRPFRPPRMRTLGARLVFFTSMAVGAFAGLRWLPALNAQTYAAARVALGVLLVYCLMDALSYLSQVCHRAAGLVVPAAQQSPARSRTLREFWGQRWNRIASGWLMHFVFRPLVRRSNPAVALFATFVVSGAMHAWLLAAPLGLPPAIKMCMYFVIQGLLVLAEIRLRVAHFPTWARRVWTYAGLLVPAPLFINPFLQVYRG